MNDTDRGFEIIIDDIGIQLFQRGNLSAAEIIGAMEVIKKQLLDSFDYNIDGDSLWVSYKKEENNVK